MGYYEFDELKVKEETLISKILEFFHEAVKARHDWEVRKKKNHDNYYGILPEKTAPWKGCSNVHVPITQIVTDTYHANLMTSFFRKGDMVDVKPVSSDDIKTAKKTQQYLNYQAQAECTFERTGLRPVADKLIGMSLIYGDAYTKERYARVVQPVEEEIESVTISESGEPIKSVEKVVNEKTIFDGIIIDTPNPDDIFKAPDSTGTQASSCAYLFHRVRIPKSEYEFRVDDEGYSKIDFKQYSPTESETWATYTINQLGKDLIGISSELMDSDNYITLLEFWGEFYNEKTNKYQEICAIIHPSSRTVCKAFINDLGIRPITQHSPRKIANQPYGIGIPEMLKYLQAELNTIHNQRRDSETKRICMPGFYDPGSDFDPQKFILEPNGMYPVRGGAQAIYFPQFQDAPSSLFNEEELLYKLIEQLTAASQPIQGVVTKGEQTATEFAGLVDKANIRFDLIFKRYEDSFKEMFDHVVILDQRFMPAEKQYRIVGQDGKFKWESITKLEMNSKYDLYISGASIASEMAERQSALTLYQVAVGSPLISSDMSALYENTKAIYEAYGVKDIDRRIPIPPQSKTRTPVEEHEQLYKGVMVYPDPREDAQKHLSEHLGETSQKEYEEQVSEDVKQLFFAHIQMTQALAASQNIMKNANLMKMVGTSEFQPGSSAPAPAVGGAAMSNESNQ